MRGVLQLSIFDIEQGVLTGKILEHQTDSVTLESKYRIRGQTLYQVRLNTHN